MRVYSRLPFLFIPKPGLHCQSVKYVLSIQQGSIPSVMFFSKIFLAFLMCQSSRWTFRNIVLRNPDRIILELKGNNTLNGEDLTLSQLQVLTSIFRHSPLHFVGFFPPTSLTRFLPCLSWVILWSLVVTEFCILTPPQLYILTGQSQYVGSHNFFNVCTFISQPPY